MTPDAIIARIRGDLLAPHRRGRMPDLPALDAVMRLIADLPVRQQAHVCDELGVFAGGPTGSHTGRMARLRQRLHAEMEDVRQGNSPRGQEGRQAG